MELNRVCSDCGTSLDRRGRLFCSVACKKRVSRRLLRLGVTPLTSADDVLEALGIVPPEPARPEVGEVASWLLERLPASADELVRASALTAGEVAAALAELETAQLVAEAKASTLAVGERGEGTNQDVLLDALLVLLGWAEAHDVDPQRLEERDALLPHEAVERVTRSFLQAICRTAICIASHPWRPPRSGSSKCSRPCLRESSTGSMLP